MENLWKICGNIETLLLNAFPNCICFVYKDILQGFGQNFELLIFFEPEDFLESCSPFEIVTFPKDCKNYDFPTLI